MLDKENAETLGPEFSVSVFGVSTVCCGAVLASVAGAVSMLLLSGVLFSVVA
jgi:membrane protein implicated in regulation of membrane protease activity